MPIYTKTGDKGETSLYGGKRVSKSDPLVEVYGSIDELNSWVGLLVSEIRVPAWKTFLQTIQTDLFTIGSTLAGWKGDLSMLPKRVSEMEQQIDAIDKELPELRNFIRPGGSQTGAYIHITRSVCRKAERKLVNYKLLATGYQLNENITTILQYINRLSDLFFMLARFINDMQGVSEVKWSGISKRHVKK